MENSIDQHKSGTAQPISLSTLLFSIKGIYKWVRQFFTLTEDERSEAGICLIRYRLD